MVNGVQISVSANRLGLSGPSSQGRETGSAGRGYGHADYSALMDRTYHAENRSPFNIIIE